MKRMLAVLFIIAASVAAQETKKSEAEAMMDYYIDAAKPVEEHKRLAELTGPWKVTTRLWFEPAGEPQVASGTGTGRAILGGRFVVIDADVKGAMGTESMTIFGFDRRTNDYTMIGLDTLGTYWISAAGKYDGARKGVILDGSYA